MRLHRFLLPQQFTSNQIAIDDREAVHQISRVLKLVVGEEIAVFNGLGAEAICRIVRIDRNRVELEVIEKRQSVLKPAREVVAYIAILKRDNFEWAVQKATEIGVTTIVPIVSRRTVKLGVRYDRLERIAREASEQCGRSSMPVIAVEQQFTEAIDDALKNNNRVVFFDFSDTQFSSEEISKDKKVAFFIGPEGGFETSERMLAEQKGCLVRSLGQTTLRAETAVVVASYLMQN